MADALTCSRSPRSSSSSPQSRPSHWRLLFLAERVVVDAIAWKPEVHLLNLRWYEKAVRHRGRELVHVGGHARLKIEEFVGVPVDLIPRRRGQAHQQRVEVPKDGPVLLIHRPVRLVDDHEVEMPDPEAGLGARRLVDQPHHRRIGADVDSAGLVLLGHQVHRARLWQVGLERPHRLVHQRHPVGQKTAPASPSPPAAAGRPAPQPRGFCRCRSPSPAAPCAAPVRIARR